MYTMYVHTQCIKHICVVIVMDVYIYIIYMCKIPCNNHLLRIVTKLKTVTLVNIDQFDERSRFLSNVGTIFENL